MNKESKALEKRIEKWAIEESLNPYVMRMNRLRADEAQLHFWSRFRELEKQGLIPDWLCVCTEGRYLSCSSCGVERDCNAFPIVPSTALIQEACRCGGNSTDEWHCPWCLKCLEYQRENRPEHPLYLNVLPGSITQ